MATYPLLFTFVDKVEGNGFLANIRVDGRLLAEEEDGWWMYGVNPGGLAAEGDTRAAAYIEFRQTLMKVLFDLATEAADFYAFRAAGRKFFEETSESSIQEWEAARAEVRAGKVTIDGMRRETAESPRRIEITQKQAFAAKDNATDPHATVAA